MSREPKDQYSAVGSLLANVLRGVPSFSGDTRAPYLVPHALVGFLSRSPVY